jgi:hypothetical protein
MRCGLGVVRSRPILVNGFWYTPVYYAAPHCPGRLATVIALVPESRVRRWRRVPVWSARFGGRGDIARRVLAA